MKKIKNKTFLKGYSKYVNHSNVMQQFLRIGKMAINGCSSVTQVLARGQSSFLCQFIREGGVLVLGMTPNNGRTRIGFRIGSDSGSDRTGIFGFGAELLF